MCVGGGGGGEFILWFIIVYILNYIYLGAPKSFRASIGLNPSLIGAMCTVPIY